MEAAVDRRVSMAILVAVWANMVRHFILAMLKEVPDALTIRWRQLGRLIKDRLFLDIEQVFNSPADTPWLFGECVEGFIQQWLMTLDRDEYVTSTGLRYSDPQAIHYRVNDFVALLL